ncbi:MAG: AI-2E family transporter [Ruminococcaceae bacterium]|nr:AI-2E family transporter [Oscillospiraceae bacterium]
MQQKITLAASVVVLLLGGGALFYLFFKYIAGVFLPFLLGWGLAMLVRRPAAWLHEKTRIAEGVARLALVAVAALLLGVALVFGLRGALRELSLLASRFGGDSALFAERIKAWLASIPIIGERLAAGSVLQESLSSLLAMLPSLIARIADVLPAFFFTLGVGVIAAVYFCLDLDRIHAALAARLSKPFDRLLRGFKDSALRAAVSVLRAQALLTLIAFVFLLVGFLLLNVNYPLLLSGLIALLDFLPVLGVGLFLVPWGVLSLLAGERALGVGLLILFALIAVTRQFLEPRILGRRYGLHPLVTLLSLYAGGRLFGVFGLLVLPMLTLLLFEILFSDQNKKSSA